MNDPKIQKQIEKQNKQIEDAILVYKMMETPGYKIASKTINDMEKEFRFQDIMGVTDGALSDQKGIVMGINKIKDYFKRQNNLSLKPRQDPETGEVEVMNEKNNKG